MEKRKILIIDDEKDFLTIVKLNLEETGDYKVVTLDDGREIIDWVHSFKPDAILIDILMPTMGGLEVCKLLNNDSIGKNIPIIVLSALEKDEDKLSAFKVGVVDYLVKPITKDDLISKIEKALKFKK